MKINAPLFLVRTESRRIFDITDCEPITDNKYGINFNGVLPTAKQVSAEYVADLLSKGASIVFKKRKKTKRRAVAKAKRNRAALIDTIIMSEGRIKRRRLVRIR